MMKNIALTQVFVSMLLIALPSLSNAAAYRYIDPNGRLLLTNVPQDNSHILLVKTDRGWEPQKRLTLNTDNKKALSPYIKQAAERHKIPYHLIHAVIRAESGYNAHAISHAGAQGLMQLMPATAERFGVRDPFNPKQNINGGSRYLSHLLTLFKGDYKLALAAYNAGENAVIRYGNQIPPFKETQNYVRKVLLFYKRYRSS